MTMKVALELIPKETIDKYADIECDVFGEILVKAMGINGNCLLFKHSKHEGCYRIGWILDNGEEYHATFDYDTIVRSLKGKSMTLTMDVYTRE